MGVERDFIAYSNNPQNNMKRFPICNGEKRIGGHYVYNDDKGLQWKLYSFKSINGYENHSITAIINPKVLIGNDYIHAAQAEDLNLVKDIFNKKANQISSNLYGFDGWSMNRADYCLNIDTEELGLPCTSEQLMKLIKRANIPKHFIERIEYNSTAHRPKSDPHSLYLQSKSVTINFYSKYHQQNPKHPNFIHRDTSYNVLRLEVQCRYPKLYAISKSRKSQECDYLNISDELDNKIYDYIENGIPLPTITPDSILTTEISHEIVEKYIYKTIRKGDYFTLDGAKEIVESYNFRPEEEERLLYALDIVSKARGIAAAKEKLSGLELDDFKRSLNDLDEILVNPVTIPRKWNIAHVPNPIRAYCDVIYEECLLTIGEYIALQHIKCYVED